MGRLNAKILGARPGAEREAVVEALQTRCVGRFYCHPPPPPPPPRARPRPPPPPLPPPLSRTAGAAAGADAAGR
eukprot:COSAG01_NODE_35700_length_527_cov_307.663551_1_plen_73_part_10